MADMDVLDATGATVTIRKPNANGRAAEAASEPIALSTEDLAVLTAIKTAIELIDNAHETNRLAVNLISGQVGIAGGTGVVGATVPRVTLATDVGLPAGETFLGFIGSKVDNPSANFTRPNDTTAYASGDLVANSTTAGSVAAMAPTVARVAAGSCFLRRAKLHKSGTSTTNAVFRVHVFEGGTTVTPANGDNGAFSTSGVAGYLGAFDITIDRAFTDGAAGFGYPVVGSELSIKLTSGVTTVKCLIEARAAYTPTAQEVFTLTFDDGQN